MGVAYSAPLCPSAVLSCYSFVIPRSELAQAELSWPKPQCTCNAMVTSQAQHSTNEGVLRSNSACSMVMSNDLRLLRRGIEPRPFGFWDIGSTARPSPLPTIVLVYLHIFQTNLNVFNFWEQTKKQKQKQYKYNYVPFIFIFPRYFFTKDTELTYKIITCHRLWQYEKWVRISYPFLYLLHENFSVI